MAIGIPRDYFQTTSKPHIVTDIELDETVNAIHDIEDDISARFNGTTGHSHNAVDGQGPNLAEAVVVFHDTTGHTHEATGNKGTPIPWAGINALVKSDLDPIDIGTKAPGSGSKFSRYDHVHAHAASLGVDLHHPKVHASTHHTAGDDLLAHDSIPGGITGNPHAGSAPSAHSHGDSEVDNGITLTNITQITTRSHTSLSSIGGNSHTIIDGHLASSTGHTYVGQDLRSSASPSFVSVTCSSNVRGAKLMDSGDVYNFVEWWNSNLCIFMGGDSTDPGIMIHSQSAGGGTDQTFYMINRSHTGYHKYGMLGTSTKAWSHMYCYSAWDDNGALGSFDEHDDLALIDAIQPLFDAEMEEELAEEEVDEDILEEVQLSSGKTCMLPKKTGRKFFRPKRDKDGGILYKLDAQGKKKHKLDKDGKKILRRDKEGNALIDPSTIPSFLNRQGFSKMGSLSTFALGGIKQLHKKVKDQEQVIGQYGEKILELEARLDALN